MRVCSVTGARRAERSGVGAKAETGFEGRDLHAVRPTVAGSEVRLGSGEQGGREVSKGSSLVGSGARRGRSLRRLDGGHVAVAVEHIGRTAPEWQTPRLIRGGLDRRRVENLSTSWRASRSIKQKKIIPAPFMSQMEVFDLNGAGDFPFRSPRRVPAAWFRHG